jgi:dihydropteroate synthase
MAFRMKSPILMGVVNVTPDSFSDGGQFLDPHRAIDHGLQLVEDGASIIDIGGESTRPGAAPISVQEELDRILPVIEGLKVTEAAISVDTYHAATMKAALDAGATIINDITALRGDAGSLPVIAGSGAKVCLMHMQGEPRTMQNNPVYGDVVQEVFDFLRARIEACEAAGITRDRLMIDPGIGFGKNLAHNMALLKNLRRLTELNVPVVVGVSRKSFISKIGGGMDRLPGSLAAALYAWQQGASIFRVHDVAATRQAFAVHQAIFSIV